MEESIESTVEIQALFNGVIVKYAWRDEDEHTERLVRAYSSHKQALADIALFYDNDSW